MGPILVILFIVFVAIGVPISFALGVVSFVGIASMPTIPNTVVFTKMFNGMNSFTLLAVPLFILAANLMNEGDITNVAVDERSRRRGIGRALVHELIHRAADRGISKIFLEVRDSNESAIQLYQEAGFVQVGLRKHYYSSPTEDARIMRFPV